MRKAYTQPTADVLLLEGGDVAQLVTYSTNSAPDASGAGNPPVDTKGEHTATNPAGWDFSWE